MTLALLEPLLFLAAAGSASAGLLILQLGLQRVFAVAPRLKPGQDVAAPDTTLTVVIPAFNEAHNIEACVASVLANQPPCRDWSVLVVDDESSDATVDNALRAGSAAPHFRLIQAGPRPVNERWVGKNWACSRAVDQVSSEWLLFIDADVRLKPDALKRALAQALDEQADLLSLAPRLSCGCLAEWMAQPIMASLLGLGFPILETNDPASPVAFAAGPFMLFKASTYRQIGGHRALAGEVVEDLALARAIKAGGHRLRYLLGLDAVDLRMYSDLAALWEGWTKNWFLGLDRDPVKALGAALVVVLMFSVPWLLLPASLVLLWLQPLLASAWWWLMALTSLAILQQLLLRLWTRSNFDVPLSYWWLMGAGGLLVGAIGPVSIWRTRTGRGWTWKGRALN
ncbi:beta-glycosyltransferase/ family 2 [Synechococcus sp. RS9907]|uniref:glycosyltransferase n=1 Tax=Synechococcus sp. RS9907 TaxID=221350 RepID=UPI00165DE5B6|nr:glycosyltransferase family 2 protein [Synechococcus sp. RS9907]QNI82520.1 beta-glycosyltransferase/ family 2 [Synechococcus sp. RS9907]